MAAFSITYCASLLPKGSRRMLKLCCLSLLATLALSACAPSDNECKDTPPRSPFDYEFA